MGWGSSTRRGGGRKLRARPRNFVFLGFRREESGMSREFCRDVPDPWRCSKSLCKKNFVRIFRSLLKGSLRDYTYTLNCSRNCLLWRRLKYQSPVLPFLAFSFDLPRKNLKISKEIPFSHCEPTKSLEKTEKIPK